MPFFSFLGTYLHTMSHRQIDLKASFETLQLDKGLLYSLKVNFNIYNALSVVIFSASATTYPICDTSLAWHQIIRCHRQYQYGIYQRHKHHLKSTAEY